MLECLLLYLFLLVFECLSVMVSWFRFLSQWWFQCQFLFLWVSEWMFQWKSGLVNWFLWMSECQFPFW
jgi:hypothetical protein